MQHHQWIYYRNNDFEYLFVINYLYHHQDFFYEVLKDKLIQVVKSVPKARNPFNVLKNLKLKWYPPYSLNGVSLNSDLSISVDLIEKFYYTEDTGILRVLDFVEEEIEYLDIQRDEWKLKRNEEKARELEEKIKRLKRQKENLITIKNLIKEVKR